MRLWNSLLAAAAVIVSAILFAPAPLLAQDAPATRDVTVTVTARVKGGGSATLSARDVFVHEDRSPRRVISFVPAKQTDSAIQMMILIDADASPRLGAHFQDVSQFIEGLPATARIGLAYAMNGSARIEQALTTDHAAVAKALHVTFGPAAGNTSIYAALSDLMEKWPGAAGFREVLLLSDGIDPTYGFFGTQPGQNPGLQRAIRDAQKNGVTVFSVFVSSGRITRNQTLNLNGQGSLNELTASTGGYSFTQGTRTPVSFRPFLEDLRRMLGQQYLLTFEPPPTAKAGFHDLKVSTEMSGVKLLAPKRVYIPASASH